MLSSESRGCDAMVEKQLDDDRSTAHEAYRRSAFWIHGPNQECAKRTLGSIGKISLTIPGIGL